MAERQRWRPRFSLAERQRRRQGAERGFWSFSPRSPVRQMGYLGRDEPVRYRGFIGRDEPIRWRGYLGRNEVEEPSRLPVRAPVPIRQLGFLGRDEVEEPSRLPERAPVLIRQMGFLSRKGKPLRTLL